MPIKGLAEKPKLDEQNGRFVKLGRINKGSREGFGKGVKLHDLDHFRFTPYTDDITTANVMRAVFEACYGVKPQVIDPVYFPINISGNFHIEDRAWLLAFSYSEKRAPILLGRSDGEWVYRYREDNRTVKRFTAGDLSYNEVTRVDEHGNDCLMIDDKLYPWQQRLSLELILPDFNDELYKAGLSGFGVVEFNTTSIWDVSTLLQEYRGIIGTIADAFCNPFKPGDREHWIEHVPLREVPLRLYRQEAQITRPDPKKTDPLARYKKPTSLCHLQISPTYARALAKAHEIRGKNWLVITAASPMLQQGAGSYTMEDANADFFGEGPIAPQLPAGSTQAGAWNNAMSEAHNQIEAVFVEDVGPTEITVDGEIVESEVPGVDDTAVPSDAPDPEKQTSKAGTKRKRRAKKTDPKKKAEADPKAPKKPTKAQVNKLEQQAREAGDPDTWSTAVWTLYGHTELFSNVDGVTGFLAYITGNRLDEFDPFYGPAALMAVEVYVENRPDGTQKDALAVAEETFLRVYAELEAVAELEAMEEVAEDNATTE